MAFSRQGVKHPTGTENAAVTGGQGGRQHHKVDNPRSRRDPHFGEGQHEGTGVSVHGVPRIQGQDHRQRTDVENEYSPNRGVDRFGQRDCGILRFTGGHPDQFHPQKTEHHHLQR